MIKEHDCVALTDPIPSEGLTEAEVGTVVHVYKDGEGYEVEFFTVDGRTAAVVTLESSQVRPVTAHDLPHTRDRLTN